MCCQWEQSGWQFLTNVEKLGQRDNVQHQGLELVANPLERCVRLCCTSMALVQRGISVERDHGVVVGKGEGGVLVLHPWRSAAGKSEQSASGESGEGRKREANKVRTRLKGD